MPPVSSRTTSRSTPAIRSSRSGLASISAAIGLTGRRFAYRPSPLRSPSRPCSGRGASGSVRVPLRPADGAEQHGVGVAAGGEHLVGERGRRPRRSRRRRSAARRRRTRRPRRARGAPRRRSRDRSRRRAAGRSRALIGDGLPRRDVEPHVLERQRPRQRVEDGVDELVVKALGQLASCASRGRPPARTRPGRAARPCGSRASTPRRRTRPARAASRCRRPRRSCSVSGIPRR